MKALQKITTQYVDREDRIRLAGETVPEQAVVLWLTQRLLQRLVPPLCQWLEQHSPVPPGSVASATRAEVAQGFAQQAALAELQPQAPVVAEAAETAWLVTAVDVQLQADGVQLVFRSDAVPGAAPSQGTPVPTPASEAVSLHIQAQPLRQWLAIVHGQVCEAGWPLDAWPAWMDPRTASQTAVGHAQLLH